MMRKAAASDAYEVGGNLRSVFELTVAVSEVAGLGSMFRHTLADD